VKGRRDGDEEHIDFRLLVDLMGPYGTSLVKTQAYSHVLAIGAGTGTSRWLPICFGQSRTEFVC
jgi:NAD(P)H-flavin reductase